jgi:hypothetical protein
MPLTRRQLLKRCLTAALLGWLLPVRAGKQEPGQTLAATLRVYVDILIPADETPGASQLGVDRDLLKKGRENAVYQRILELGVAWLDRQAREMGGEDFVSLEESARISVVTRAAEAGMVTLEGMFFQGTRIDAFQFYYARPAGWQGIAGYHGPPQPLGYMDQHRPPGN